MQTLQDDGQSSKKNDGAKALLNRCARSCTLMNYMSDDKRPEWYSRNKKVGTRKTSVTSQHRKSQASSTIHSSIKSFAVPKVNGSMKQEFQQQMALLYYPSGASFQRV